MSLRNPSRIIKTLLCAGAFVFLSFLMSAQTAYGARTDEVWHERAGTYLETIWAAGRNILINGANKYLNFGSISGSSGYGFRDNAGNIEFKNSGGSWTGVGTGGGGGTTTITGTNYWTYLTGFLSPATTTDAVRASYFVATSTTKSTFPYASSTALTVSGNTYLGSPTINPNIPLLIETNEPSNGYTTMALKNTANDGRSQMTFSAGSQDYYEGFIGMSGATVTNYPNTMEIGCGSSGCGLNFWTDGFLQGRMGTTGNLGLGTTTSDSKLTVQGFTPGEKLLNVLSTAGAPMFTVTGGGNLGIGTSTPQNLLSVLGSAMVGAIGANSGGQSYFGFQPSNTTAARAMFGYQPNGAGYATIQGSTGKGIQFNVNNATFGSGTALDIESNGNIGIGTTSPSRLLTVQGNGYFLNNITAASSTITYASSTALSVSGNTYLGSLTGLLKGTSGLVSTASNGTDYTLITGTTCSGTDKVSAVLANGTVTCTADQSGGGGGSGGGWATTTNANPEAGEAVTYTSTDVYIGGSTSSSTAFSFDPESSTLTIASTTAVATGTIFSQSGALKFGSSTGESVEFNFNTPDRLSLFSSTGVGIFDARSLGFRTEASSTFLGALSISTSTPDYTNSIFNVATSTAPSGTLFNIRATSTRMNHTSSLADFTQETGARIGIGGEGYYGMTQLLDQIVMYGRVRNPNWFVADCPIIAGATAITSDTAAATGIRLCDQFDFYEDNTATLTGVGMNGYTYAQLGTSAVTDGAGVFLSGVTGGFLKLATSTPSMEVTARIGTIAANATTTSYYIGFSNLATAGTTYETEPSAGCYFVASTTRPTWRALCRTAAGNSTFVDTTIPTTTIPTGLGVWDTFRIDADAYNAVFYIKHGSSTMQKVANISGTYPGTTFMNAGVHMGRTNGTYAVSFQLFGINVQWRRFTPNL